MLDRIETTSPAGGPLTLKLDDPSNGYAVQDVKGLGPVKAILVSTGYAQRNGSFFQSSTREERFITIELGLEEGYNEFSVSQLRQRLYAYFMPQTELLLKLFTDELPEVWISGIVESCEPDQFTKDPKVDVVVKCFDPDFYQPTPVILGGLSTETLDETVVNYTGTLETGFELEVIADREVLGGFSVYIRSPNGVTEQLDFTETLDLGDTITISTVPGSKGAFKNGSIPVLYGISPQSPWLMFRPGNNGFRLYAEGDPLPYSIEYTNKYGGL